MTPRRRATRSRKPPQLHWPSSVCRLQQGSSQTPSTVLVWTNGAWSGHAVSCKTISAVAVRLRNHAIGTPKVDLWETLDHRWKQDPKVDENSETHTITPPKTTQKTTTTRHKNKQHVAFPKKTNRNVRFLLTLTAARPSPTTHRVLSLFSSDIHFPIIVVFRVFSLPLIAFCFGVFDFFFL